jgi:hypothetical protein
VSSPDELTCFSELTQGALHSDDRLSAFVLTPLAGHHGEARALEHRSRAQVRVGHFESRFLGLRAARDRDEMSEETPAHTTTLHFFSDRECDEMRDDDLVLDAETHHRKTEPTIADPRWFDRDELHHLGSRPPRDNVVSVSEATKYFLREREKNCEKTIDIRVGGSGLTQLELWFFRTSSERLTRAGRM